MQLQTLVGRAEEAALFAALLAGEVDAIEPLVGLGTKGDGPLIWALEFDPPAFAGGAAAAGPVFVLFWELVGGVELVASLPGVDGGAGTTPVVTGLDGPVGVGLAEVKQSELLLDWTVIA